MSKDGKKVFLIVMLTITFVLAGCGSDSSGVSGNAHVLNATAANFDEVFNSIKDKPGNYLISLTGDMIDYPGIGMETAEVNITLKGTGANKITWKYVDGYPPLFYANAGKLTLENINLSRSPGNTQTWPLLNIDGGTIEIKSGVALSNYNGSQYFDGVWMNAGAFIISGGIIEKCNTGIGTNANGVSITMSGGTIRNNHGVGIGLWGESENCTVTISGGTISGNDGNGVSVHGTENSFTMSGGTIGKNGDSGLYLGGANSGFEKKKGAIIYGNSGDNKNDDGAINVNCEKNGSNSLRLEVDAGKDEVYAVKINAGRTDIVPGSKQGPNW